MRIVISGQQPFFRTNVRVVDDGTDQTTIDASNLAFASPLELVAIVALANEAAESANTVVLAVPQDPDVASYIQRMDIFKHIPSKVTIQGDLPDDDRSHLPEALLEVTKVVHAHEADEVGARVTPLARKHVTSDVTNALFMGVGEFLDNACSHAASQVGAFVAAQTYSGKTSGRRGLELAVADCGMGILKQLDWQSKVSTHKQ